MTSSTISIKNVDEKTWRVFKSEAAKHGMSLGEFFSEIVEEHAQEKSKEKWEKIFEFAGSISSKEAEDVKERAEKIRKEFKLRDHDIDS